MHSFKQHDVVTLKEHDGSYQGKVWYTNSTKLVVVSASDNNHHITVRALYSDSDTHGVFAYTRLERVAEDNPTRKLRLYDIVTYIGDSEIKTTRAMKANGDLLQIQAIGSDGVVCRVKNMQTEQEHVFKTSDVRLATQTSKGESNMSDKRSEAQGTLNAILRLATLQALVAAGKLTEKEALFASHCANDETLDQAFDKQVNKIKEAADYDRQEKLKELRAEEERLKTVDEKRADVRKKIAELEKQ